MVEQERQLLEQQRKQELLQKQLQQTQQEQKVLKEEAAEVKQRIESLNGSNTGYISVRRYCNELKIKLPLATAKSAGKLASKICKTRQIPMGSIKDEMYGHVNTYPYEIIEEAISLAQA